MKKLSERNTRNTFCNLLARYFNLVPLPSTLQPLINTPDSHIVVTQSSSVVIEALLHSFAIRASLKETLHCRSPQSVAHIFTNDNERTLKWLSIDNAATLNALVNSGKDLKFVTLNIFQWRGPIKNNPSYRLNIFDLGGIICCARMLVVLFGTPFAIPSTSPHVRHIARRLKLDFYRNLKLVRGTPLQRLEVQAQTVLGGSEFEREIDLLATKQNSSRAQLLYRARKSFYSMAADPKRAFYMLGSPAVHFIVKRLFSEVIATGVESLRSAIANHTVILVPMHRSHLDYILIGHKLYDLNLNPPIIAAGVNLSFWPFGFIIRSLGGYFVKRNARHDRLHALLLKRYVSYLIKRGCLQEFFIEGGRSRSGKMRPPRLGLLSIMVEAFAKGTRKDILFVPVSITYENVIEDKVFGDENTGAAKQKETLFSLFRARRIFRKRYGEVTVKFGEPLHLSRFLVKTKDEKKEACEVKGVVSALAYHIIDQIRIQSSISLTSLAYTALMMTPSYTLTRTQFSKSIKNLAALALRIKDQQREIGDFTPSLHRFLSGQEELLDEIARGGIITRSHCLDTELFIIPGKKRFTADFYKNATVHLFFLPSLLSILHLMKLPITIESALKFHEILKYDFQLPEQEIFAADIEKSIQLLKADGALSYASEAMHFTTTNHPSFIPALLLSSIQGFLWIYFNLNQSCTRAASSHSFNEKSTLAIFSYQDFILRAQTEFRNAMYLGIMTRTEAASHSTIISVIESLAQRGIVSLRQGNGQPKEIALLKRSNDDIELLSQANKAILEWQIASKP